MSNLITKSFMPIAFIALAGCFQHLVASQTAETDVKAIRDADAALVRHAKAKNVEGVVDVYATDASFMTPNLPAFNGKEAIRGRWKQFLADPNFALICTPAKVEVSKAGDYGFVQGTYIFTMTDGRTKMLTKEIGKYVMVFKRQPDRAWKIATEIFNADGPAVPAQ
jgi:ketosteroid isomerase-like protein